MINWRTLLFGLGFGLLDSVALPVIKGVSIGWSKWLMIIPVLLYASSPFIFLQALSRESLTIMNLVWDLSSDVVVTLIGLVVFAEKISPVKLLGVISGMVSLILLTYEGPGWNGYLAENFHMKGGIFE